LKDVKGDLKVIYDRHIAEFQKKLAVLEKVAKLENMEK